jgi:IclR family acetate operon transcriptional repressor
MAVVTKAATAVTAMGTATTTAVTTATVATVTEATAGTATAAVAVTTVTAADPHRPLAHRADTGAVGAGGDSGPKPSGSAKALVKGLALVGLVAAEPDGLRLAEIVRRGDVAKATAIRLLDALTDAELLRVDDAGLYRLGPTCAIWGSTFLGNLQLREQAGDLLERLTERTGETCHLGLPDGIRVLYVARAESPHSIRMVSRTGSTNPLYSTGLGKAILAWSDEATVDAVIAAGLEPRTPATITDPDELRREIRRIRRRGYSIDNVENEDGVRCVGAPVFDHEGRITGGLSIAGPTYRMTAERVREYGPEAVTAAAELSRRLGWSGREAA